MMMILGLSMLIFLAQTGAWKSIFLSSGKKWVNVQKCSLDTGHSSVIVILLDLDISSVDTVMHNYIFYKTVDDELYIVM